MKYTLESIIEKHEKSEKLKYLFFWGHSKNGNEITKSCFSQWYESPFEVEGVVYKTAEHWMMAKKAELFGDTEILEKIIQSKTPAEAKKLGRKVKNFDNDVWNENRCEIVVEGNRHKFTQNPEFKEFLLNTGSRILVEASPVDAIWGIGMAKDHKDIYNPSAWKGENLLGFALMEVRDLLNENES